MYLDSKLLHTDILKRLNAIKKPQRHLPQRLGVQRSTLYRLSIGREITMGTFLKLLHWLDEDSNRYIKRS